jgi:hypothetical protein
MVYIGDSQYVWATLDELLEKLLFLTVSGDGGY